MHFCYSNAYNQENVKVLMKYIKDKFYNFFRYYLYKQKTFSIGYKFR